LVFGVVGLLSILICVMLFSISVFGHVFVFILLAKRVKLKDVQFEP